MHYLIVATCLAMVGCAKLAPNKVIVEETHYCEANGLTGHIIYDWVTNSFMSIGPVRVECRPKEK